jgi:hypothetical protein
LVTLSLNRLKAASLGTGPMTSNPQANRNIGSYFNRLTRAAIPIMRSIRAANKALNLASKRYPFGPVRYLGTIAKIGFKSRVLITISSRDIGCSFKASSKENTHGCRINKVASSSIQLDFGICSPYKFDKSGGEAFVFAPVKPNFIEFFQYARFSVDCSFDFLIAGNNYILQVRHFATY